MGSNKYLCIHGHFYQPPRENAWLEQIEKQDSAFPYHDWNERIHYECYLPNSLARVLDKKGRILNIINNYEKISFNFGPTLLSWLEQNHSTTYRRILRADRKSKEAHHGHGNAVAQVYNHVIMPLANRRDKVTQIRWGIYDFQYRFGRNPESIWLAETACNEETLDVLVEAGMRFLILSPYQAEKCRPLGKLEWTDVSMGQIDPKHPYRHFLKNYPEKFIDIFFYDGPISKDIGFGDILWEAKRFMNRLDEAYMPASHEDQLIHVATDGETYGHHKAFADRVLGYLMQVEAKRRGYQTVNYGEYLDKHPPQYEVKIKAGENGEGTSWSCAHGVSRWKNHCGCRGYGPGDWTQHWRRPLRDALDWLRDEMARIFEDQGTVFFKDVWEARNDYIQVVLDRSEKNVHDFFASHARYSLSQNEITLCLKLLEMQRHAMLMYTSCGWFFTELSGIETVQILQYAARALQLAEDISQRKIKPEFLSRLTRAKSNIPQFKDARWIYENMVEPRIVDVLQLASFHAIYSTLNHHMDLESLLNCDLYTFRIRNLKRRVESFANTTLHLGRMHLKSKLTLEEWDLIFAVVHIGLYDFRCSIKLADSPEEYEQIEKEIYSGIQSLHVVEILRRIDHYFGETYYALKDLPLAERTKIISLLTQETIDKISIHYENLYDESRRMNEVYRSINLPIPGQVKEAAIYTLNKRLKEAVLQLAKDQFDPQKAAGVYRIIDAARSFEVELKKEEIADFLSGELARRIKDFLSAVTKEGVQQCLAILQLAKKMELPLHYRMAQDYLFFLTQEWREHPGEKMPEIIRQIAPKFLRLMLSLNLNPVHFKQMVQRPSSQPRPGR